MDGNPQDQYELSEKCAKCGHTFGEHCTADDACPIYTRWGTNNQRVNHGGFNRASKFTPVSHREKKSKGEILADEFDAATVALAKAKRELEAADKALEEAVAAMIKYLDAAMIRRDKKQV